MGWTIAKKIWNEQAAIKVAWVLALFPSLILYSVIIMKEIYVCFFLLVAFKGIIYWFRNNSFNAFILTLSGFVGATFFHGAMIAGAILFISVVGFISFKNIFKSAMTLSIKPKYIVFFLIFVISSGLYFNKIKVPKLGHFQGSVQIDSLLRKTIISTRGDASYPEWTKINSQLNWFTNYQLGLVTFVCTFSMECFKTRTYNRHDRLYFIYVFILFNFFKS